ncbi:hypothetical protein ACFPVY_08615 [Flavobacterium qiangtangense]|uniref:Secreted protein (Por secretion system target) n=1 Tax=Flavobacterium qiangtangense TaxID=1442595 RepID=A0ABW1PN77_9FLAO
MTFLFSIKGYSQVDCYAFSESAGIYSPLSSTTTLFSGGWDDNISASTPIGFTFKFNGSDYTNCFINSNGYLTFGSASGTTNYDPISSGSYNGAVSAFGRDLVSNSSTVVRGIEGSSPNRVFVIQWNNARRYAGSSIAGDNLNFQIRLYETTNKIDIVYGTCTITNTTSRTCQIGLRGSSTSDFNNRSLIPASSWLNNTLRGTSASASVNSINTSLPASGTTFTWLPNSSLTAPTSITAPSASVCAGSSTTLTAVGGTTSASTLWFEGNCGNVLFSEEWNSGSLSYPSGQTTVNSISGGVLTVTSHNVAAASADAQIDMQTIFSTAFVPATYKNIAIRYRVVSGDAIACEIYFKKGTQSLAEDKVVRANLNNDNNWHIINLDMSTNSYWNNTGGNITGWRFDYTRGPNVKMEIDYIALTDRAVLENTNANENIISVLPTAAITDYYALRVAESTCFATTSCSTVKMYRNKTWNGGPTGDWSIASNWIPVGVPTSDDCIDVPSTLTMAITGSHAVGKTLDVSAGNFTVNSGSSVTLQGALTVGSGATFTLQDGASLVQEGTTNTNSGNIIAKRNAKPMKRYDFTYWSSPVSPQTLYNLSPNTLGDKYYSWDADAQAWLIHYNGAVNMVSGKGYIARAPQSYPIDVVNSTNFEGNFTGVPNSGDITIGVVGNATTLKWNLIGNPYPSAILIDEFLTDSFNSPKISGTIYLWTHNSPPTNAIVGDAAYNYTSSDYAAYNGVGGTATSAAIVNPLHPIVNSSPNPNVPNGYLASGQSFFVGGKSNAASSVKFTNSMREKAGNNQFFRTANSTQNTNDKSRIWINLRNNEGAFNQTLVGYLNGATNEIDDAYDGELFGGNYVSIYSLNSDKNLTIQGRALPFETSDVVPLGLNTTIAGTFSISLDGFDGLFLEQDIFLKDKLLNVTHNLKNGGYEFATAVGTFNDRFEIIYQNTQLGINDPVADSNQIIVYKKDKNVFINSGKLYLESVKVFDIQGKLIHFEDKINNKQSVVKNLPDVNQVLIVQVKTNEGIIVSKKIIL